MLTDCTLNYVSREKVSLHRVIMEPCQWELENQLQIVLTNKHLDHKIPFQFHYKGQVSLSIEPMNGILEPDSIQIIQVQLLKSPTFWMEFGQLELNLGKTIHKQWFIIQNQINQKNNFLWRLKQFFKRSKKQQS